MISYQFLHLTIIQGYSKLSLLDKGFPKGGGGGGPTFGKNSQIISFFFFESVPYLHMCYIKIRPSNVIEGHNHAVFVLHRQALFFYGHTKRNRALLGQHIMP